MYIKTKFYVRAEKYNIMKNNYLYRAEIIFFIKK